MSVMLIATDLFHLKQLTPFYPAFNHLLPLLMTTLVLSQKNIPLTTTSALSPTCMGGHVCFLLRLQNIL